MIHLGLTGYPLEHSLSPQIHSAALNASGLEGDYSLFPILPNDLRDLKDLLARVRAEEIHGLNVTIPHKQNVIQFLDELSPTAKAIGAVNTIFLRNEKLVGDNTDAPGFLSDLKRFLGNSSFIFHPSALVLGAGGSARAVVYALVNDGWNVTVAARRAEQAQQLASQFDNTDTAELNFSTIKPFNFAQGKLSNFQLIVNTTPVGMMPNINQSPWSDDLSFPPEAAIYDLVYNPRKTKLVKDACSAGLPATTGLGMLVEQAALAFELWTGQCISRDVLFSASEKK